MPPSPFPQAQQSPLTRSGNADTPHSFVSPSIVFVQYRAGRQPSNMYAGMAGGPVYAHAPNTCRQYRGPAHGLHS
eukprot:1157861-Pelagomonas_calceolata.AAC.3